MTLQPATLPAVRAPEFPPGFAWVNTSAPLSLRALRGKVVLLDFWTHGCINCQHVLPDLEKLARKYLHALVVVGVHSAKFEGESSPESVRHAAARLGITHPVVVDEKMRLWSEYAVRAWPTLALIDASGKVTAQLSGEGHFEQLDKLIAGAIEEANRRGILNDSPLQAALAMPQVLGGALRYPGKVLAYEDLVFIADSGHNRVVVARWDGESAAQVLAVAGSGARGLRDDGFAHAAFSAPQGMALRVAEDGARTLFVADTANHAIRALDLERHSVSTVAGTGRQAAFGAAGGAARESELSSPWDLALGGGTLFVAMAGAHQVWALDLESQTIAPWAGSGREARADGPRAEAMLAQPSGLALGGGKLFFADAESSSVRLADLQDGRVETLSGGDADGPGLFTFGDRDGARGEVLLQHPLAVAVREHGGARQVLVADTYNHKAKVLAPDGSARTLAGGFDEPGGLSVRGSKLLVADTNHHTVKVLDLETLHCATLALAGLEAPRGQSAAEPPGSEVVLPSVAMKARSVVQVLVEVVLPAGHHLSEDLRHGARLELEHADGTRQLAAPDEAGAEVMAEGALRFSVRVAGPGRGVLRASFAISYCSDGAGVCRWASLRLRSECEVSDSGLDVVELRAELEPSRGSGAGTPGGEQAFRGLSARQQEMLPEVV